MVAKAKAAGLTDAQATAYAAANKEVDANAAQTALDGIVAENKRIADKKLDLFAKAQTAGLDATRAQTFANNNVNTADGDVANALTADVAKAVTADKGGTYTGSGLTNDTKVTSQISDKGQITTPYGTTYTKYTKTEESVDKTYNQPYSVVVGKGTISTTTDHYSSSNSSTSSTFKIDKVAGLATLDQNVPTTGKAVYTGGAFSAVSDNGKLNYLVDFDKRKGSGDIQGLSEFGAVKLLEGNLTKVNLNGKSVTGVSGSAQANAAGSYTLGLFGPQADEVAGKATIDQKEIGFAGQKDANATLKKIATDAGLSATRAQAYADAYVAKDNAADALKTAIQIQADDLAKLVAQGTAIGLTDSHAQTYATKNLDTSQEQLKTALDIEALIQATEIEKSFADKNKFSLNDYKNQKINESTLNSEGKYTERKGWNYSYQQPYSMVLGTWLYSYVKDDVNQLQNGSTYNVDIAGFDTKSVAIPTEGKATYTGSGVRLNDSFDLAYNVDFSKQTGSGYLLKASNYGGKINLDEGAISKINLKGNDVVGITSTAKGLDGTTGNYSLGFYGSQAQEISGSVEMNGAGRDYSNYKNANSKYEIGFGGIRGEITK